jgi:hypothetical protein
MDEITTVSSNEESDLPTSLQANLKLDPVTWAVAGTVAKWVGEKAAGGLVSAAMGKVFGEVMDAIGMGGPNLVEKLDKIGEQLVQVQKSLDRLTDMTAEILKQLAELKEFMEKSLQIQTLITAMTRIDVAYGSASDQLLASAGPTGRAISLRLLVEKMPHYKDITKEQLAAAAKEFATYVSDLPTQIEIIHTTLAKAAFGQTSLLTHWAKELAQQVKAGKIGHDAAYLVLEGYFLQAVSMQLKGVSAHCVALGTGDHGPELISDYLQDTFAKTMKSETSAFVEAVELFLFLTLKSTMPIGSLPDGMGEREFPKALDEILLRADLLSAALNLISFKVDESKPPTTIQAAIQGIYGRALFRPSDLNNETPPHLMIAGYTAAAPTGIVKPPFVCLDLIQSGGNTELRDASASPVTMAHYFWKFNSPEPAAGQPIDRAQRGGVTPARYPVFGADKPVLAASVFDVSRLYRGLPSGTKSNYRSDKFPGGDPDLGVKVEEFKFYHNPLTVDKGDAFETFFTVHHIWRLDTRQNSWVVHPLFKYSGKPAKVRLTAFVASIIVRAPRKDGQGGTAFGQTWDVFNRLHLWHSNGSKKTFYISVDSFGNDKPVSNEGSAAYSAWHQNYKCRRDGHFTIDFDLEAGQYELAMQSEAAFWRGPKRYEGWQSTSLAFFLHGISIERV